MRIASCSLEIDTHAASLQYVCEYVLSDVRDGGKPYRTTGTCMVEEDPVGPLLRVDLQSWGASLKRPPFLAVLLLALVGSLLIAVLRPPDLSPVEFAVDSADLKNLLLKKRVACDRRRSEVDNHENILPETKNLNRLY